MRKKKKKERRDGGGRRAATRTRERLLPTLVFVRHKHSELRRFDALLATGSVRMPEALKALCVIHIGSWENSPFPLLALWGNKNGFPSMKVKKLENLRTKLA